MDDGSSYEERERRRLEEKMDLMQSHSGIQRAIPESEVNRMILAAVQKAFNDGVGVANRTRDRFELIKAALTGLCANKYYGGHGEEYHARQAQLQADAVLSLLDTEAKRESEDKL